LGVGGSVLAQPLLMALYGEGFAAGAAALAWLVWVPALIGIHSSLLHALNASGRTLKLAQVFAFNLGLNVSLNLLFIPRFGIAGAAAVSVLCQSVNLVAAWVLARRASLAPVWKAAFWPALPAALGMGLALWSLAGTLPAWPLGLRLPALIAAGALIYAALLGLLGFVGPDERAIWHRLRVRA
jgi:O-antigen/teichoic acid export membrane protein